MGVGGGFWDLLKPIAHYENLDYLRGKKVAIDLSFWIVQQETALKGNARKPHLRLTFFRTINLFAKLGAFPVFVVDGNPPALKSPARMERFCRMSGIDAAAHQKNESSVVARNPVFNRYIEECVELLELMGMPVLRAQGEAEALCAQLDREGWVDACITTDSDAFLHGAKCVVKCLRVDCKEPIIECYRASDIETGLKLKRKHLIALALLVGCDYNSQGVPGIGLNTAVHIVRLFQEEEILDKLRELGKGNALLLQDLKSSTVGYLELEDDNEKIPVIKVRHCSHCGHPGNKVNHHKLGCEACKALYNKEKCVQKSQGWTCQCASCIQEQRRKEHKKSLHWQTRTFAKIYATDGFPNEEIVHAFLAHGTSTFGAFQAVKSPSWKAPQMELLEEFLNHHLYWDKSYTRQKILPLCSVLLLRKMAAYKAQSNPPERSWLLYNRYAPHSIGRVKVRYSQSFYVLKWKHVNSQSTDGDWLGLNSKFFQQRNREVSEVCNFQGLLGEDVSGIEVETVKECLFITTDEDMELVRSACPELVENFEHEKAVKGLNKAMSKRCKEKKASSGKQLSITSYFKAAKGLISPKARETASAIGDNRDDNAYENYNFNILYENTGESISTPIAVLNDGEITEGYPVSQVVENRYASAHSSNEGEREIIRIDSEDDMNDRGITRTVRRRLF